MQACVPHRRRRVIARVRQPSDSDDRYNFERRNEGIGDPAVRDW